MVIRLAAATGNAMVDAVSARMVSGSIKIYTGSQPANGDAAATGTLLATLTLDATPVAAGVAGVANFNDLPLSVVADANGTAGWFRVLTSGAAPVYDGKCGVSGDPDIQMTLSTTSLVAGVAVTLTLASQQAPLS